MTVFVDDYRVQARVGSVAGRWSHLVVEPGGDLDELHAFAERIGLRREWFQGPPRHKHPHYDVTDAKRRAAIAAGAQAITWRRLGEMLAAARTPAPESGDAGPGAAGTHQCSIGFGDCDRTDTRPYATGGWRCPDHSPWFLAGRPDPSAGRYCLAICYCGGCPDRRAIIHPNRENVIDFRHKASGKRRTSLTAYREAQEQTRPKRQDRPAS